MKFYDCTFWHTMMKSNVLWQIKTNLNNRYPVLLPRGSRHGWADSDPLIPNISFYSDVHVSCLQDFMKIEHSVRILWCAKKGTLRIYVYLHITYNYMYNMYWSVQVTSKGPKTYKKTHPHWNRTLNQKPEDPM